MTESYSVFVLIWAGTIVLHPSSLPISHMRLELEAAGLFKLALLETQHILEKFNMVRSLWFFLRAYYRFLAQVGPLSRVL